MSKRTSRGAKTSCPYQLQKGFYFSHVNESCSPPTTSGRAPSVPGTPDPISPLWPTGQGFHAPSAASPADCKQSGCFFGWSFGIGRVSINWYFGMIPFTTGLDEAWRSRPELKQIVLHKLDVDTVGKQMNYVAESSNNKRR